MTILRESFPAGFCDIEQIGDKKRETADNKGFSYGYHVRIFGFLREPNAASHDAGFSMVSYFGDTPFGVEVGTCGKSGLETRITTSPIWPAVGIETR